MERPTQPKATEKPLSGATRRDIFQIGNVLALPVLMSAFEADATPAPGPLKTGPGMEVYQSIGVEPVINCRGTFTIIGASVELPEVRAAMDAACQYNVQLDELADAVGRRLAELTGAEWGMVSAGCAAGLKHVTAACVAGGNPEKLVRIPDLTGFDKTEVVIPRSSRSVYDHAIRNVGVKVVMVDTIEELQNALNSRTAMIYLSAGGPSTSGPLALENVAKIAKPRNIPILVDAAAEILTIPNVHLEKGATIVAYSGGKAIRGPQCAGLLLGRKDILMSVTAPHDSGFCFGPVVIKPTSRGRVMLRAPVADSKPRVLCNFLTTEEDRQLHARGPADRARDRRAGTLIQALRKPYASRPATPTRS